MDKTSIFFDAINQIKKNEITHENVDNFFKSAIAILENASVNSKIKDKFEAFYYRPSINLICFLKSEKTESTYQLLYDSYTNEIVFSSWIKNWQNIKNLNDSFWSEFLEKGQEFNFKFRSSEGPFYNKEKTPEFNVQYKSLNFNIMSVYITAMLESETDRQNIGFGDLEIVWTPKKSTTEVISELNIAFKYFYKFNYNLWKISDIRRQNRINRDKNI